MEATSNATLGDDSSEDEEDFEIFRMNSHRVMRKLIAKRKRQRLKKGRHGPRLSRLRKDPWESTWGKMLLEEHDLLLQPDSHEAVLFRKRFRAPFILFQSLVEWTSSWLHWSPTNPDGIKPTDSYGQARIPTELKVLGVLRILH